jgi:hypothetical protein
MKKEFAGIELQLGHKYFYLLMEMTADTVGIRSLANKRSYTALGRRRSPLYTPRAPIDRSGPTGPGGQAF